MNVNTVVVSGGTTLCPGIANRMQTKITTLRPSTMIITDVVTPSTQSLLGDPSWSHSVTFIRCSLVSMSMMIQAVNHPDKCFLWTDELSR